MFDSIDIKKELIKIRGKSENDFLNSVNQLLDNDVSKESEIEKNITKSNSIFSFQIRNIKKKTHDTISVLF